MKPFGENLKALMERDRISIAKLAKLIGEPPKTLQEWIGPSGRTPRSLDAIPKLAAFFKVSSHFLICGEEDPHSLIGNLLEKTELHVGLYEISIRKVTKRMG